MNDLHVEILDDGHRDRAIALQMAIVPEGNRQHDDAFVLDVPSPGAAAFPPEMEWYPIVVARDASGALRASCTAAVSPARSALVFIGGDAAILTAKSLARAMLQPLADRLRQRGILLLQANVEPGDDVVAGALRSGAYRPVARLAYLNCDLAKRMPVFRQPADTSYLPYSKESEPYFLEAMRRSYVGSLDCPSLLDLRDVGDVLVGHRYTGVHDPSIWFVAMRGDRPVGILLLAGVSNASAVEVVYVGVANLARGRKLGDALMSKAVETGRKRGVRSLVLAVDAQNTFARALYDRWCFVETRHRDVWILTEIQV